MGRIVTKENNNRIILKTEIMKNEIEREMERLQELWERQYFLKHGSAVDSNGYAAGYLNAMVLFTPKEKDLVEVKEFINANSIIPNMYDMYYKHQPK